jgi:hypothetical protein
MQKQVIVFLIIILVHEKRVCVYIYIKNMYAYIIVCIHEVVHMQIDI